VDAIAVLCPAKNQFLLASQQPDRPADACTNGSGDAFGNGLAESLIGSIQRDCLDHVVILASSISAICSTLTKNITTRVARIYRSRKTRSFHATPRG